MNNVRNLNAVILDFNPYIKNFMTAYFIENEIFMFNGLAKRRSQLLLAMNVLAFVCATNGHLFPPKLWKYLDFFETLGR